MDFLDDAWADPSFTEPAADSVGTLLHSARCMAGLTQAEVAQRAGVSQQMVATYERGRRQPTVATLRKLVAGCGLRLVWRLTTEPGPADEPALALLARPPLERLDPALAAELLRLVSLRDGLDVLAGGKLAARLHGANLLVPEIELWVDPLVDLDALTAFLARADVEYVSFISGPSPAVADREWLHEGWPLASNHADIYLRSAPRFQGLLQRATEIPVPGKDSSLLVASPDDCVRWWDDRDIDHLELQRAVRLARSAPRQTM